jgi:hypothetical protein
MNYNIINGKVTNNNGDNLKVTVNDSVRIVCNNGLISIKQKIKAKKVRKGVTAFVHPRTGAIEIEGVAYYCHSMTSAIQTYRRNNPLRKRKTNNNGI